MYVVMQNYIQRILQLELEFLVLSLVSNLLLLHLKSLLKINLPSLHPIMRVREALSALSKPQFATNWRKIFP